MENKEVKISLSVSNKVRSKLLNYLLRNETMLNDYGKEMIQQLSGDDVHLAIDRLIVDLVTTQLKEALAGSAVNGEIELLSVNITTQ